MTNNRSASSYRRKAQSAGGGMSPWVTMGVFLTTSIVSGLVIELVGNYLETRKEQAQLKSVQQQLAAQGINITL